MDRHNMKRLAERVAKRAFVRENSSQLPEDAENFQPRFVNEKGFSLEVDQEPSEDSDGGGGSTYQVQYVNDSVTYAPVDDQERQETDYTDLDVQFNKPEVPDHIRR